MRIIFKANSARRSPLRMLLCNPLLHNTRHFHLLPLPQLADNWPLPLCISNHRVTHPLIRSIAYHHQIARIYLHDLISRASRMQGERNHTACTTTLAVTVARIHHVNIAILRVQRDQAETVCDKLIGEDRGVGLDLDDINGYGGDFSEHHSAHGVGECEVN